MAIIADYRVISAANFRLHGSPGPGERSEVSFSVMLPAGVALTEGNELLLQYQMLTALVPGPGNQIGIAVDINGSEVGRDMFIEHSRMLFIQHIIPTQKVSASSANTIRLRALTPISGPGHNITFGRLVLWFQRDANAPG